LVFLEGLISPKVGYYHDSFREDPIFTPDKRTWILSCTFAHLLSITLCSGSCAVNQPPASDFRGSCHQCFGEAYNKAQNFQRPPHYLRLSIH
jgi:hypothetical protein